LLDMQGERDSSPKAIERATAELVRPYEATVLDNLAAYAAEYQKLTNLLLSGSPMKGALRRELERRITFAASQVDRLERIWHAHVRENTRNPSDRMQYARMRACAYTAPVLPSPYDADDGEHGSQLGDGQGGAFGDGQGNRP
jgi:hypothetical protein